MISSNFRSHDILPDVGWVCTWTPVFAVISPFSSFRTSAIPTMKENVVFIYNWPSKDRNEQFIVCANWLYNCKNGYYYRYYIIIYLWGPFIFYRYMKKIELWRNEPMQYLGNIFSYKCYGKFMLFFINDWLRELRLTFF